jgi:hypothetical protein
MWRKNDGPLWNVLEPAFKAPSQYTAKSVTGHYVLSAEPSVILGPEAEGSSLGFQAWKSQRAQHKVHSPT